MWRVTNHPREESDLNSKHRTRLCLITAGCALAVTAQAQVKTDDQWRGTGGAALAYTSGNSDTSSLALTADLSKANAIDKISFNGFYNYARSTSNGIRNTTADKWGAFGQYDYNLTPRTYVFGKLGLEGDKLIDLNLRASLAGGAGYKLIDTDTTSFNLFGGVGYSRDAYDSVQTIHGRMDTHFSRSSLLLGEESSHKISDSTSFKQRLEFSPGVSGDKAKLAKFTAGLNVAMTSTLALTVGLTDTYNSQPPAGSVSNDVAVFTGISYKIGPK